MLKKFLIQGAGFVSLKKVKNPQDSAQHDYLITLYNPVEFNQVEHARPLTQRSRRSLLAITPSMCLWLEI